MSTTLNLVDRLATRAQQLQSAGFTLQASQLFERLARFRDLPSAQAEDIHKRLGQIRLERGQYIKARRHLAAAIAHKPSEANSHFLLAAATQGDDRADPRKALDHLRQAVQYDSENPKYLAELGLQALALGETAEGLAALRKAIEQAPDDPAILAQAAEGFRHADCAEEARCLLRAARFRHPGDRRFQQLWHDFHFQALHEEQQARKRLESGPDRDAPALLPFIRPEPPARRRRAIRKDSPALLNGPHARARQKRQINNDQCGS